MKHLIAIGLALSVSATAFADHANYSQGHNRLYFGLNTGVSVVNNQSYNHYSANNDYTVFFRDESSARGYNGGLIVGYNFFCDCHMMMGVELGGNLYSNRGHETVNFYNRNDGYYSNFEFGHDMEYSFHITARPSFIINRCTLFYFNVGAGFAKINFDAQNLIPENAGVFVRHHSDNISRWGLTLGAGIHKRITNYVGVFGEYQYTYYGECDLGRLYQGNSLIAPIGSFANRSAIIDANVFKFGLIFNM